MKYKGMIFIVLCGLNMSKLYAEVDRATVSAQKIVVIGAGIAGLTTAYRLHKKGFDVHVYEARSRVGGRIFSAFMNDNVVELGGQNIADGGVAENVHQLIQELGLTVAHYVLSGDYFFHHNNTLLHVGELIKKHNFNTETLEDQLLAIAHNSASMHDVLDQLFKSDDVLKTYFSTRVAGYEGAFSDQLSSVYVKTLYRMLLSGTRSAHQEKKSTFVSIVGGNSKLAEALAKKLENRVHLEMPLTSVVKNNQGQYLLTFKDGFTTLADILVLAVPCPIYNDIIFGYDVIPSDRLMAIRSIHNGSNAKILINMPEDVSQSTILVNNSLGVFPSSEAGFTLYFCGQSSFFGPDTIAQRYADAVPLLACGFEKESLPHQEPVFAKDELFAHYSGPVGYSWPNDPFAKGTYSYIAPGQEFLFAIEKNGDVAVKTLFAPIDQQLYFVGEHASTLSDVPGTMEAACQSGNLAADMIESVL